MVKCIVVPAEDWGSVPGIRMMTHNHRCSSYQGTMILIYMTFTGTASARGAHTYMHRIC